MLRARTSVCKNRLEILTGTADRAVLDTLSEDLLQAEAIEHAIKRAVALVRSDPAEAEAERRTLTDELGDRFPEYALQAVVSLEKGQEFKEITGASYPGRWKVVFYWPMDFTFPAHEIRAAA